MTLRVGLIGAGLAAKKHLPAYLQFPDAVKLAAVCDVSPDAAGKLAAKAGIDAVWADPFRMIREAPVDAIDICTPNADHSPFALAAAHAGKHILVEKPMATTLGDCLAMVEAAEKSAVTLMVAMNQRFRPINRAIYRAIQQGQLGRIRSLRMDSMLDIGMLPAGHWVFDGHRAGGGVLISYALQRLDLAIYLFGPINRICAICHTIDPRFINSAEDHATVNMEFASGPVAELFATYAVSPVPWAENLLLFGERATIHTPPAGPHEALIAYRDSKESFCPLDPAPSGLPTDDMFINTVLHFADCAKTGHLPLSGGRENLAAMRALFAAYESSRSGMPADAHTDRLCHDRPPTA